VSRNITEVKVIFRFSDGTERTYVIEPHPNEESVDILMGLKPKNTSFISIEVKGHRKYEVST